METCDGESSSCDENLLTPDNRDHMLNLAKTVKSFRKKDDVECIFCQEDMKIHNLHDAFRVYGAATSCLVHHTESVIVEDLLLFFEAETFVLRNVQNKDLYRVHQVLGYRKGAKDVYEEALKEQLVAIFKVYFSERSIKINCEQDIESITYNYYKLMSPETKKSLSTKDLELILVLLFRRNEFVRFFRVFESSGKTYAVFKLALLLSINPECHVATKALLKKMNDFEFSNDSFFADEEVIESLCDIKETITGPENVSTWIEELERETYWADCVKVWAANREHDTGAVDNSMVELCIKHKRYEDGWEIYDKGFGANMNLNKICTLCLNGLRDTQDKKWINRIIEVIGRAAAHENPESSCVVADNVLTKISDIPEVNRNQILEKFMEMVDRADKNEDMVNSLLRGFLLLCNRCSDTETCSLCAEYANRVYNRWKKCKRNGFLFSRRRSTCDAQIYSSMLGVCDAVKDCEGFYNVCKDLTKTNTSLDRDLCIKLERFHNKNCKDCTLRRTRVITNKNGRVLIFHFLNKS